jgi:hypothetical protein
MERTNSILAVLKDAEVKLNSLRNRFPCGIRSVDDETDRKIQYTAKFVAELRAKLGQP